MQRSRLRFAMITTFYPPYHFGGDANYVRQFSEALVECGHEVDVIHDRDAFRALSHQRPAETADEQSGIRLHGTQSRWPLLSSLATHQSARPLVHGRKIKRILDQRRPDIIHYHNISLIGGPGVLAYGEGIKIYTAHEHWLVCPTHVLWRNNSELCDEQRCLKCQLSYRRPRQLWRQTGFLESRLL